TARFDSFACGGAALGRCGWQVPGTGNAGEDAAVSGTMPRVIHPGWLTSLLEDDESKAFLVFHSCTGCGHVISEMPPGRDLLREHVASAHSDTVFNLDLYRFRYAFDPYHGDGRARMAEQGGASSAAALPSIGDALARCLSEARSYFRTTAVRPEPT